MRNIGVGFLLCLAVGAIAIFVERRRFDPIIKPSFQQVLNCHLLGKPVVMSPGGPVGHDLCLSRFCAENDLSYHCISADWLTVLNGYKASNDSLVVFDQKKQPFTVVDVFPPSIFTYVAMIGDGFTPTVVSSLDLCASFAGGAHLVAIKALANKRNAIVNESVYFDPPWVGRQVSQPFEEINADVVLRNLRAVDLVADHPTSTCSCATISGDRFISPIPPGGESLFSVKMLSNGNAASRQFVVVSTASIQPAEDKMRLGIPVYCWQLAPLWASRESVDFGSLSHHGVPERQSVVLGESDTDHFEIEEISSEAEGISHSIHTVDPDQTLKRHPKALRTFSIDLTLDPRKIPLGQGSSSITIKTTSKHREKLVIPIKWKIVPVVNAYLRTESLALDAARDKAVFTLSAATSDVLSLSVESCPRNLSVSLPDTLHIKGNVTVSVNPQVPPPDGGERIIVLIVKGLGWAEMVDLDCSKLYIQSPNSETATRVRHSSR